MVVERIQLLRNVGQFDSVNAGAQLPFTPLTLLYAENGRGKTTFSTIMRSLGSGDGSLIEDRRRLGSQHSPHVVLTVGGVQAVYQNGAWNNPYPHVAVFDDTFVAANVCAGIEIEASHRQNLHEMIVGAQGVALNGVLQTHVAAIEQHNRDIRLKETAIPTAARGALSVDAFCALPADPHIDARIEEAERAFSAAQAADAIRQRDGFLPIALPRFDIEAISGVLGRTLADLQGEAARMVREHLAKLGRGGEAWVGEGFTRAKEVADGGCPFCAQSLVGSALIVHYEAYFSEAYEALKVAIVDSGKGVAAEYGGDMPAAFERGVRVSIETRDFWRDFLAVPDLDLDTAGIVRDCNAAREAILSILRSKLAAPLEPLGLPLETLRAVEEFHRQVTVIEALSDSLVALNADIALVKEQAAAANIAALLSDLDRLKATKARHTPPISVVCDEYLTEKAAKIRTEGLRDQARAALDQYRQVIFPTYEAAINDYLSRFNAGFRIGSVGSVNTRGGSSASYNVLINNVRVNLTANSGPSFRTTLSAGDRNTLALAFFFASLDQDPQIGQKIAVIDDPMTSLDEHRSLTTIEEVRGLLGRARQVIVLSHSKSFLCAMWEGANAQTRSAFRINRDGSGSTLAAWDVRQDSITEHDRRHAMVRDYLRAANAANERAVAQALRPILEAYLRVAYPTHFPPGSLIGPFLNNVCRPRFGQPDQVLNDADVEELQRMVNYGNRFHHDSNPAWQTAAINDQELSGFALRTLRFTSRG